MFLFAFFGLWPATLAVGVGAIAIPVVIHLINRKRFKIVPWAAMRFLMAAQKQTRKRMRIEQLLLLLVRMLILATIVFAMASVMPWAEDIWASWNLGQMVANKSRAHRIHHVIVLDTSLSMNQMVDGQPAFEKARQLAVKKIQDNPSGDGYSVLLLKESPTWLVREMSQDAAKVVREIEAVQPSHGNASLSAALNMIAAKLGEGSSRFPVQAVYFFTDLQETTWAEAAAASLKTDADGKEKTPYLDIKDRATTIFVDVGRDGAANLAVTDLSFDDPFVTSGSEVKLTASVHNFSKEKRDNVRVELLFGKAKAKANDAPLQMRVVKNQTLNFAAGQQQTVKFDDFKFPTPGTYAVQVKIAGDVLEQDDARTTVITVRETIPVLLVNGKASAEYFERAVEYLNLALNPFRPGEEPGSAPLRPRVVSPSQFSEMNENDLEAYDCIYWCDVGQFGVNELRRIDAHLRRGGGFVVTMGDKAAENLEVYNRLLYKDEQGLLPAKLMKKIEAPKDHHFYLDSTAENNKLPPLALFEDPDLRTLRTARFRQFVQAVVPEGKARTVMTFRSIVASSVKTKEDKSLPANAPAIVEWNPPLSRAQQAAPITGKTAKRADRQPSRYRGRVILMTSTVNMDWTSWPGSPSFVPVMNEITRYAISGRLRERSSPVGGLLEDYLPGGAEVDVTLQYPAGTPGVKPVSIHTQTIDEVNLFRFADTDYAGVYRVETSNGLEIPFAVNVPGATADQKGTESDLSRVDETKLRELYPGWTFQIVRDALGAMVSGGPVNEDAILVPQPVGPRFANIALLVVLGLLFLEIVLAWRFGHYTTTEGMEVAKFSASMTTMVAAVIAVLSTIFFVIGAVVIGHELYTGDLLGFLPDLLRTWFENVMEVPPPLPGEGKTWRNERMPFLFGLGGERWWALAVTLGAIATIFFTYKAEAPKVSLVYKLLLGALRLYLILLTLWFLLPRPELRFERTGWPDMVLLIDDTRSMGEPDSYQDSATAERAKKLGDAIREQLIQELPDKLRALEAELAARNVHADRDADAKADVDAVRQRLEYWNKQKELIEKGKWRPSRLQLVQALLAQPEPHWLKTLLGKHHTKIHLFHLDVNGRAIKLHDAQGDAGEIIDPTNPAQVDRAAKAIAQLEPVGNDSRLGTAVRQVVDHYRGSSLSSVIMFTDGVTTRDETISQAADYASQKGISLFFIGLGDEHQFRDLKLDDLDVQDTIYLGDRAVFKVKLTGKGYKNLTVPVVLKVKDKNGKEVEVAREMVKVDPAGKTVVIHLHDQPKEIGRKEYIVEVKQPDLEQNEKPLPVSNLRLERGIDVIDAQKIKVLYVEGQPRYEFRYIKFLMEREALDAKKNKSIELKVLLLDADDEFAGQDKTALATFPATLEELNQYDVLIMGDCDPNHKKLQNRLKDVANFVKGEDEKGRKASKPGGGILFMAGAFNNPHRYKGTPLADVLPVEPTQDHPPPEVPRIDRLRPELTPVGRMSPIFGFSGDETENVNIWQRLTPMYWYSSKYRLKGAATVLAVHPTEKGVVQPQNPEGKHPLVVQQFTGSGRSMFFGFDETWRWRLREDEVKYNNFWIQTMRYLARGRSTRTTLALDRQVPYFLGDKIKIKVTFPESGPAGAKQGPKLDEKTEVKVSVQYQPPEGKLGESVLHEIKLAKVPGSTSNYDGTLDRTREGKYRFWLTHPDVTESQPDRKKPSAEAIVILPPGELDKLRMDQPELARAATETNGKLYTLVNADSVLEELPPSVGVSISSPAPPQLLWNHWVVFLVIVFLITSEWILRKMKHLL